MREAATIAEPDVTSGDAERATAFRMLAERHLDPSFRLANAILGNPAEAEDAVQDAFVTAWRKWDTLRDPARFEAWFKRVVVNTCRDRLRRRARTSTTDISLEGSLTTPDTTGSIADRMLVGQALARLRPADRILIVLRHDRDLRVEDIGHLLGIPAGTVKWRLSMAHRRLRAVLGPLGGTAR